LTLASSLAAGWTPCIGSDLGGIIGLAATSGGWRSGLLLVGIYSAGLAILFLITGWRLISFLVSTRVSASLAKVELLQAWC